MTSRPVVVIGAGNAAFSAALSAREKGAEVIVLERAPKEERGGNTAFVGGALRMICNGVDDIKQLVPNLSADLIERRVVHDNERRDTLLFRRRPTPGDGPATNTGLNTDVWRYDAGAGANFADVSARLVVADDARRAAHAAEAVGVAVVRGDRPGKFADDRS